jgi:hypothetical protein
MQSSIEEICSAFGPEPKQAVDRHVTETAKKLSELSASL